MLLFTTYIFIKKANYKNAVYCFHLGQFSFASWIFSIFVVDAEASFVDLALSARLNPAPWLSRPLLLVARPAPPLVTPHCSVT